MQEIVARVRFNWIQSFKREVSGSNQPALRVLAGINPYKLIFLVINTSKLQNVNGIWDTSDTFDTIVEELANASGTDHDACSTVMEKYQDEWNNIFNNINSEAVSSVAATGVNCVKLEVLDWVFTDIARVRAYG